MIDILLWPFKVLWGLVSFLLSFLGRLFAFSVGFVFILVGFVLVETIIGAVIGLPLLFVGALLVIRSLFA